MQSVKKYINIFSMIAYYLRESYKFERDHGSIDYDWFRKHKPEWAQKSLSLFPIDLEVKGTPTTEPSIFVGNHMSYFDIVMLMAHAPLCFLAKAEVEDWPIIGHAAKRAGIVFVKREDKNSRKAASSAIAHAIKNERKSICVFPSGTTSMTEDTAWRYGVFEIAKEHGIAVQPFRLNYAPTRNLAYIGNDFFPTHLWKLVQLEHFKANLEFASPIRIQDPQKESEALRNWAREVLNPMPNK
jgi:1-acyl-sn-glycerol-3-phosphate acyltransferase